MVKQKIYFPNLNGIRFIAALLVIISHNELFKSIFHIPNYWGASPFVGIIGKLGVVLFFVLSGFLITYLLLAEEHEFKKISVRKFYVRRILRIWPLYFFIIILALLVLPNIDIFTMPGFGKDVIYSNLTLKIVLFALFFPNLLLMLLEIVPYASHTWSIGTEEQFYLIWPVVLKYLFKKYRIILMLAIVLVHLLTDKALSMHFFDFIPYKTTIQGLWTIFNIDCMAIGGLFAILLFRKNKILKVVMNKYFFYFVLLLAIVLIIKGVYIPKVHHEFYAFLFGVIIINFAANKEIKISLENRLFNYLGNISYGLYMYHPIAIVLSLYIASSIGILSNWLLLPMAVLITVSISALSYKYLESFFLKFKDRFSNVLSGARDKL